MADYSSLVKDTNFDTYTKNKYKKINDYQRALDGKKPKKGSSSIFNSKVSQPLGADYFYKTDLKCNNYQRKDRYIYVDGKPKSGGIYSSALFSINKIPYGLNDSLKKCVKKKKKIVGINGKKKSQKRYIESFISPNLQEMNAGQQFFIGSIAVIGLYLFYKAIYKK
jgi:hypothetical protein